MGVRVFGSQVPDFAQALWAGIRAIASSLRCGMGEYASAVFLEVPHASHS
jgi:hypothetical protein